jgi:hypothetical protein
VKRPATFDVPGGQIGLHLVHVAQQVPGLVHVADHEDLVVVLALAQGHEALRHLAMLEAELVRDQAHDNRTHAQHLVSTGHFMRVRA